LTWKDATELLGPREEERKTGKNQRQKRKEMGLVKEQRYLVLGAHDTLSIWKR